MTAEQLNEADATILRFEQQWWRTPGAKDVAIREQLGLSPVRYYQRLHVLVDQPVAMAYAPVLCSRLRRIRDVRRRALDTTPTEHRKALPRP